MPKRLVFDGHVKTLSHDALRLYVYISLKSYRKLDAPIKLGCWQVEQALGIRSVAASRYELKDAGLIDFEVLSSQVAMYEICRDIDPWTCSKVIRP